MMLLCPQLALSMPLYADQPAPAVPRPRVWQAALALSLTAVMFLLWINGSLPL